MLSEKKRHKRKQAQSHRITVQAGRKVVSSKTTTAVLPTMMLVMVLVRVLVLVLVLVPIRMLTQLLILPAVAMILLVLVTVVGRLALQAFHAASSGRYAHSDGLWCAVVVCRWCMRGDC